MKLLENPYFYQLSLLLLADIGKIKTIVSKELNTTLENRTLDVCCGTGNFADLFDGEYTGFDLNKDYIAYAKKRFGQNKSKEFLIADINDFNFKPKHFNSVLLINALHHFSDESSLELLEKINRTAKDKIIITEAAIETKNPISRLLIVLDRGKFVRSLNQQIDLVSKKLNIVKHFTYYSGFAHGRIIVCYPKDR